MKGKLRFEDEPLILDSTDQQAEKPKRKAKVRSKAKPSPAFMVKVQPDVSGISSGPDISVTSTKPTGEPEHYPDKNSRLKFAKEENPAADFDHSDDPTNKNGKSNTDSKLQFSKEEIGGESGKSEASSSEDMVFDSKESRKIAKLEEKADKYGKMLDKAQSKLPHKNVETKERIFDDADNKAKIKLTFENEIIPMGEAEWNRYKNPSLPRKIGGRVNNIVANKIHVKVHQIEHQNAGVEAAHKGELIAESGYRGAKRYTRSAYRHHKSRHYRTVSKLETKSIKNQRRLEYRKALRDNPKLKSNRLSRFYQKRGIKQKYAAALKSSKTSGKAARITAGISQKISRFATNIIRRNPIFMVKAGLLLLVLFIMMSLVTTCGMMLSNSTALVGVASYLAEDSDIDNAALAYSEWEVDLLIQISEVQANFPGFDEYRFQVGMVDHNPLELMAYLTAVHHNFTYPEIRAALRELFDEQYQLSFTPSVEIRHYENEDGDPASYEWHVLTISLISRSLGEIIRQRLTPEQRQHFDILMLTQGARQIVGSPFDFNWRPFITSHYGWRIHPISGGPELHRGIDIGLAIGTPILAAHDGIVTFAGDMGGYGNVVFIVSHCGEIETRYAHCHEIFVSVGQIVDMGDVIATVGNTGNSTGPHLHFEIIRNGIYLNPIFFALTNSSDGGPVFGNPGMPMGDGSFAALLAIAESLLGAPYVWGGSGPNSFDCSGFVYFVLNQSGVANIGRTTAQGLFNMSQPIQSSEARPGDLIFFQGTFSSTRTVTHVGIYVGNGQMIHTGGNPAGVEFSSINSPFWQRHFYNFGRISYLN